MINIQSLSFGYKKQQDLFHQLNLVIPAGEVCGLLGKNGAGKSTLLKIICGLLFPHSGQCTVLGHIPRLREPRFLNEIYFLPEDMFLPALTMQQYLACYTPFYPRFNHELFKQNLKEFDLQPLGLLTALSYGEKKKFLISFALATCAQLLVLDEPSNGLDIPSKAQFRKILAAAVSPDRLIILSTHQVHDIAQLVDSILILDEGKNIFYQHLDQVSQTLSFSMEATEPLASSCFYFEKQMTGFAAVKFNEHKQDTQIDLELLFKAVLANKNQIQQLLNKGIHHG